MPSDRLIVLILGGYGTFGGRLAELLAAEPSLRLIIAGRSTEKAAAFCRGLAKGGADAVPVALDRDTNVKARLEEINPDLVVDAAGPFQTYGENPHRLVTACLALGIDYLDLADDSYFVEGIRQFNSDAARRGIFILSGVSTCPVLTAAVVAELTRDFTATDSVTAGIAPSPYAGVGLNVIRAISGYAGKPVTLIRDGTHAVGYALTETLRYTIAPPGRVPLRNTLFSLVDVPDLKVLPEAFPGLGSIWVGAGPVPELLHRDLIVLARMVRFHLLPSLSPLARLFHGVINIFRWGEHRGGMFVAVTGRLGTEPVERSWHLVAEGDDGPYIPSMASAAIIRHCLAGRRPRPGARPATRELTLSDYDPFFASRAIFTGVREKRATHANLPLYRRILGNAFEMLPEPIRAMHDVTADMTARGIAEIERGRSLPARIAAQLFGFPKAGKDVPVEVRFRIAGGRETWERVFAGRAFSSVQSEGTGRFDGLLAERFGPLSFGLALVVDDRKLWLVVRRWTFLGIPLPLALAPRSRAHESAEGGRFHFHVEIALPLIGLIVRYRGWLVPDG